MNVSGGVQLIALLDGTTINGFLRTEGTPLVQRYDKSKSSFIPDFRNLAEADKPTVVAILRDSATGEIRRANTITYYYNDVALTFASKTYEGKTRQMCTNSGMEDLIEYISDYSEVIGGVTYSLHAIRVLGNLVPISSYDNDKITASGTVEISGNIVAFSGLMKEVVIQEASGQQYDVRISNTMGSQLLETDIQLVETCEVYKDGGKVTDFTGFTFAWYKVTADGDVAMGTAQTQVITKDDVDNVLKLRCDVTINGMTISGFDEITDLSDPYTVMNKIDGITGTQIKMGETAIITPLVVKRKTGAVVEGAVSAWKWYTKSNDGSDFVLSTQSGCQFEASSITVPYNDVVRAGNGFNAVYTGTVG